MARGTITLLGVEFRRVSELLPRRDAEGVIVEDYPHRRFRNPDGRALHAEGRGPFCRLQAPGAPAEPGVYVLGLGTAPLYVGECGDLAARFGPGGYGAIKPVSCYQGGHSTLCRINHLILGEAREGRRLGLWFHHEPDEGRRHDLRQRIVKDRNPPWNLR